MPPTEYPYVFAFPHGGQFAYQVLNPPVTACSLALYTPLSFVFVCDAFVHERKEPVWVKRGVTASRLAEVLLRFIPGRKLEPPFIVQCSRGTRNAIVKPFLPTSQVRDPAIRLDLLRYEVPRDKWRTRQLLDGGQPFSVEVRYVASRTHEEFLGVSRLVTVTKNSTTRKIAVKMAKVENTFTVASLVVDAFLFTSERWAVKKDVGSDICLFPAFAEFLRELTIPKERICIGLVVHDAVSRVQIEKPRTLTRSNSSAGDLHRLIAGEAPATLG
jgi:hypothetical protein